MNTYRLRVLKQEIEEALNDMNVTDECFDELFAALEALNTYLADKDD